MENLAYYNGKKSLIEEMTVPLNDRAMYFGDGVYDATFAHNHVIWALDEHVDRFFNSAGLLDIDLPLDKPELKDLLRSLVKEVDSPDQFVYWSATRGTAPRKHALDNPVKANLIVTLTPSSPPNTYKKIDLITYEDHRFEYCHIKTLNLIPSVLAARAAEAAGCHEVIFHRAGIVTECAHSNCSILKNGKLLTHPADHHILPGIGRAHLIRACKALNIPVDETTYTVDELKKADEVIITASSQFCLQGATLDGQPIGGKAPALLKKLQDYLTADALAECADDTASPANTEKNTQGGLMARLNSLAASRTANISDS